MLRVYGKKLKTTIWLNYQNKKIFLDELCNANPKFDKLTDYMINNFIDDGRFSIHNMCNYFDTIGIRPCTNIHLEGFHRQVNARVRAHPDL